MTSDRHRWGPPDRREHQTIRACTRCLMVKVTRHDDPHGFPWTEFYVEDRLVQMPNGGTPPCPGDSIASSVAQGVPDESDRSPA